MEQIRLQHQVKYVGSLVELLKWRDATWDHHLFTGRYYQIMDDDEKPDTQPHKHFQERIGNLFYPSNIIRPGITCTV